MRHYQIHVAGLWSLLGLERRGKYRNRYRAAITIIKAESLLGGIGAISRIY